MISFLKFKHYLRLFRQNTNIFKKQRLEKILNYAKYKTVALKPEMYPDKVAPVYTSILATKRCNLNCKFCVVGDMMAHENKQYDLTVTQAKKILSNPIIKKSLMVMFTGGEPLLNKNLPDLIQLCKQFGHIVSVTTNGTLLDRNIHQLVHAGIDSISVSVYDSNFKILKKKLKQSTQLFPIRLNKVINRQDVENCSETIEQTILMGIQTGCYGIIFQNMMPMSKEDTKQVIFSGNGAYDALKQKMMTLYGNKIQIDWAAEAPNMIHGARDKKCRQPWYLTVIDNMGNLGLCCRYQDPVYGNIFNQPYQEVKNTLQWQNLRKQMLADNSQPPGECINCYLLKDTLSADV